jgi:hypothetical protein
VSRPKPVRVLDLADTELVLIGCGGTGGYVLQQVCRLLYGLKEERRAARDGPPMFGIETVEGVPGVLLVDGDTVERKNLLRQYFLPADVGERKAMVLAGRYAAAYGLNVAAYPNYLTSNTDFKRLVPDGAVVVGAVDNAGTRKLLHERLLRYENVVYVDAGNAAVSDPPRDERMGRSEIARIRESGWEGQVVCGVRKGGETLLPFPGEVFPDLIEGDDQPLTEVPCGEAIVSQPQRHLTNLAAATVVLSYLTPLLSDGTLLHHKSFFDARRLYVRSDPAIEVLHEVAAV